MCLKKVFLSAWLFMSGICLFAQTNKAQNHQGRPNVLVIYTDDQGTLDMNVYGAKDLYTPNMDSLAKSGIRFTQFYSAAPICSPSRAALMTGRYPQRAGLAHMASSRRGDAGMPADQFTMGELFQQAGYVTGHIGKWHLGYTPATMPNQQGFDYSYGFMGGCIDNYSHFFYWNGPPVHDLWQNGNEIWENGQYFQDLMVDQVDSFLQENKNNPFFLYWPINLPHYPEQSKNKWREYYKNLPFPRNSYAAVVSTLDEEIGKVMTKLKELGLTDNTIVVLQSDQGYSMEERANHGGGYSGPFRGSKFSLFEGGIRVPAIISWPGRIPANTVRNQLCANVDWFPTLAELCNIKLPDRKIDGESLVLVIKSAKAASPHPVFFWQSGGRKNDPQWAVRDGNWKLLHNPFEAKSSEMGEDKLFLVNMSQDSTEHTNEVDKYPAIVKRLEGEYSEWYKTVFDGSE